MAPEAGEPTGSSNTAIVKRLTFCPDGHRNAEGSTTCTTCTLPIIDVEQEFSWVESLIQKKASLLALLREKALVAVGGMGCDLLTTFYTSSHLKQSDSSLLLINPQEKERKRLREFAEKAMATRCLERFMSTSVYNVKAPIDRGGGFWSISDKAVAADDEFRDRVLKLGVREGLEQVILSISWLGDGIGSGCSPYLLHLAKELNPSCKGVVCSILPFDDDPDQTHFSAFCGLSRLISYRSSQPADMLLTIKSDDLRTASGIDHLGSEVRGEGLMLLMLEMLIGWEDGERVDILQMAGISQSMKVQNFVPCLAIGRSLEIYGSIENVLETALASPLAPVNPEKAVAVFLVARVPESIKEYSNEDSIREAFNSWSRKTFPSLKTSLVYVCRYGRRSERIDLLLLIGGSPIQGLLAETRMGYDRFKEYLQEIGQWNEYGLKELELRGIEDALNRYDRRLSRLLKQ